MASMPYAAEPVLATVTREARKMWPFLVGLGTVGYGVVFATNANANAAAAEKQSKKGHH